MGIGTEFLPSPVLLCERSIHTAAPAAKLLRTLTIESYGLQLCQQGSPKSQLHSFCIFCKYSPYMKLSATDIITVMTLITQHPLHIFK